MADWWPWRRKAEPSDDDRSGDPPLLAIELDDEFRKAKRNLVLIAVGAMLFAFAGNPPDSGLTDAQFSLPVFGAGAVFDRLPLAVGMLAVLGFVWTRFSHEVRRVIRNNSKLSRSEDEVAISSALETLSEEVDSARIEVQNYLLSLRGLDKEVQNTIPLLRSDPNFLNNHYAQLQRFKDIMDRFGEMPPEGPILIEPDAHKEIANRAGEILDELQKAEKKGSVCSAFCQSIPAS